MRESESEREKVSVYFRESNKKREKGQHWHRERVCLCVREGFLKV